MFRRLPLPSNTSKAGRRSGLEQWVVETDEGTYFVPAWSGYNALQNERVRIAKREGAQILRVYPDSAYPQMMRARAALEWAAQEEAAQEEAAQEEAAQETPRHRPSPQGTKSLTVAQLRSAPAGRWWFRLQAGDREVDVRTYKTWVTRALRGVPGSAQVPATYTGKEMRLGCGAARRRGGRGNLDLAVPEAGLYSSPPEAAQAQLSRYRRVDAELWAEVAALVSVGGP